MQCQRRRKRQPADLVLWQLSAVQLKAGVAEVTLVLDELGRWATEAKARTLTVVLAGIIGPGPQVRAFNRDLQALLAQYTATHTPSHLGLRVIDPNAALTDPADFHDPYHPSTTGYQKLAHAWQYRLHQCPLLEKCP